MKPIITKALFLSLIILLSGCAKETPLRLVTVSDPESVVTINTMEGLYRRDFAFNAAPALAGETEVSEDAATYRFTLEDAGWSDGEKILPEHFKAAWLRRVKEGNDRLFIIKNAEKYYRGEAAGQDVGISCAGNVLTVVLERPFGGFLDRLTEAAFLPEKEGAVNGAYTVSSKNDILVFERNRGFRRPNRVEIPKIELFKTPSGKSFDAEIGYVNLSSPPEAAFDGRCVYLRLNPVSFKDAAVRKTLSLSLDRDAVSNCLSEINCAGAFAIIPPCCGGTALSFREEYGDLFKDNLDFPPIAENAIVLIAQEADKALCEIAGLVAEIWNGRLGQNAVVRRLSPENFAAALENGDYDAAVCSFTSDISDPLHYLERIPFCAEEAARLRDVSSEKERMDGVFALEQAIAQDYTYCPLFFGQLPYTINGRSVRDLLFFPGGIDFSLAKRNK